MNDKKQNEQKDELRDLDVPAKQADGVKGGVEAGASQLHDDEDIFYVVGGRRT